MKKSTAAFIAAISCLTGVIIGFLISPVKQGIGNNCGNNSGNTNYYEHRDELEEE